MTEVKAPENRTLAQWVKLLKLAPIDRYRLVISPPGWTPSQSCSAVTLTTDGEDKICEAMSAVFNLLHASALEEAKDADPVQWMRTNPAPHRRISPLQLGEYEPGRLYRHPLRYLLNEEMDMNLRQLPSGRYVAYCHMAVTFDGLDEARFILSFHDDCSLGYLERREARERCAYGALLVLLGQGPHRWIGHRLGLRNALGVRPLARMRKYVEISKVKDADQEAESSVGCPPRPGPR